MGLLHFFISCYETRSASYIIIPSVRFFMSKLGLLQFVIAVNENITKNAKIMILECSGC
jgi:hypothetical protein